MTKQGELVLKKWLEALMLLRLENRLLEKVDKSPLKETNTKVQEKGLMFPLINFFNTDH